MFEIEQRRGGACSSRPSEHDADNKLIDRQTIAAKQNRRDRRLDGPKYLHANRNDIWRTNIRKKLNVNLSAPCEGRGTIRKDGGGVVANDFDRRYVSR